MDSYIETIEKFRREENEDTKNDPLHWLCLAGLFWLEQGENSFGSAAENKISLPAFPLSYCGSFDLKDGDVTFHPAKDAVFSFSAGDPGIAPLKTDLDPNPDLISIGSLTIKIIVRGGSFLARVWDRESPAKKNFVSYKYFPVKPEYRVIAKYIRYDPPKPTIRVEGIGTEVPTFFLGEARFTLNEMDCVLLAEQSGQKLLFNFRDTTNNDTTYGGGRKFYLPPPEGDEIVLDFNLTENWPCAYTPFATCPIPPKENRLPVKVEAGELKYM